MDQQVSLSHWCLHKHTLIFQEDLTSWQMNPFLFHSLSYSLILFLFSSPLFFDSILDTGRLHTKVLKDLDTSCDRDLNETTAVGPHTHTHTHTHTQTCLSLFIYQPSLSSLIEKYFCIVIVVQVKINISGIKQGVVAVQDKSTSTTRGSLFVTLISFFFVA